jgi:hypothetical protein
MRRLGSVIYLSFALAALASPTVAPAQVICISNASPPPELPVYDQPPLPDPGDIWTPGYWGSGPYGYFWVPGTWVAPPAVGLLWTPGYWGWRDGIYVWNAGYWGPHIGFYGGVNYGFGYTGMGYEGGRWEHGVFAYNRTVNNFGGVSITNAYEKAVVVDPGASRVSFNGGSGGTAARSTPEQEAAAHEQHVAANPAQLQHERTASADKSLLATENRGHPAIAATAKPGEFTGKGVVAAREEKATPASPGMKPAVTPPGARPGGAAAIEPNANSPKTLEDRRPEGKDLAPANNGAPPKEPPKEVNREAKPPAPEVKPHPEVKPTPPPLPAAAVKPAPTPPPAAAAKPIPPPPPAAAAKPVPPPPPAAAAKPVPHVAAVPKPPPPPHPAPGPAPKDKNKKPPA